MKSARFAAWRRRSVVLALVGVVAALWQLYDKPQAQVLGWGVLAVACLLWGMWALRDVPEVPPDSGELAAHLVGAIESWDVKDGAVTCKCAQCRSEVEVPITWN